ncbi:MAG: glycerol-3-phosphate acyltransferase, partial [Dehalococcoidia bacterium]|nr:glycerol-3-phosphate acyltransferase [Dehalococcoidia bacterium]
RQYGSGRTGAANTLRTLGKGASVVAFLGDFSKGVLAVALARFLTGLPIAEVLAGLCAVAGHNWSVYIRFRGGRGVASSLGALTIMAPPMVGVGVATFALVAMVSRYVSLGSVVAAAVVPLAITPLVYLGYTSVEYLAFAVIAAGLVIYQHSDNLQRLRAGTERRLGEKAEKVAKP